MYGYYKKPFTKYLQASKLEEKDLNKFMVKW
jgi:hypothetical protein